MDSHESLAPRRGQPGVKSSNGEPLCSPESKRATTQHIHPRTTPTNTSDRSVCRFGDMCKSARCPWHHPTASGTTRRPQSDAGSNMLPLRRRIAAVRMPATGADPSQDPTPRGGGVAPPLYRPQNGCTEQWVLWAPPRFGSTKGGVGSPPKTVAHPSGSEIGWRRPP